MVIPEAAYTAAWNELQSRRSKLEPRTAKKLAKMSLEDFKALEQHPIGPDEQQILAKVSIESKNCVVIYVVEHSASVIFTDAGDTIVWSAKPEK